MSQKNNNKKYKVVSIGEFHRSGEERLNDLAAEGWEFVAFSPACRPEINRGTCVTCVFKRREEGKNDNGGSECRKEK
ncbi:MAG: DUF4177 domain-containing protein [Candidatus Aminicenantes bacterium]|nr:DUF4177 domain-containing protein [Candidatus Aminicenantes bacterium]